MGKIYTIDEITAAVKPIAEKYGIDKVWLFGSYARGEATEKSDVDLLISYQNLIGMFALGGVYSDMEDAFNKPVDIVSERALTASYASVSSKQLLMNARKDGIPHGRTLLRKSPGGKPRRDRHPRLPRLLRPGTSHGGHLFQ